MAQRAGPFCVRKVSQNPRAASSTSPANSALISQRRGLRSFFSSILTHSSTTAEMARLMSTHTMAPSSSPVRQSWYTVVEMVAVLPGV